MEKKHRVGFYDSAFDDLLGIELGSLPIYQSKGLKTHLLRQKHYKALKYLDSVPDIIKSPDYVGCRRKNESLSIDFVKVFEENILLVVRLDEEEKTFHVATLYDLSKRNLQRFLHTGQLVKVIDKETTK